jgi:hypothetical protein
MTVKHFKAQAAQAMKTYKKINNIPNLFIAATDV